MLNHISKLVKIQYLQMWGINAFRYSKDRKKKRRSVAMFIAYSYLSAMLAVYVALMAYGFCVIGAQNVIPAYTLAVTSIVTFTFTALKASGILFEAKDYEMLVSLPIKPSAIVTSRFLAMYGGNFIFTCLTMIPSSLVYILYTKPGVGFYGMIFLSLFLAPLIPMTVAAGVGALIMTIASRMKYKNFVMIVAFFAFTFGIIFLSFRLGNTKSVDLSNLSTVMMKQINHIYPPSLLYTKALVEYDVISFLFFAMLSIGVFLLFVTIVGRNYVSVCSALHVQTAKNNYVWKELKINSPLLALYQKELKKYFSLPLYVLNTAIGNFMVVLLAGAVCFYGVDKVGTISEIPGFSTIFANVAPIILGGMATISVSTASAISLEGKQWWIPLSLPIKAKTLFDSKILVGLTLSIPTSLLSSTLIAIAVPFNPAGYVYLFITPLVYDVFIAVLGIFINIRLPIFDWDNPTIVIKQSAAILLTLLFGMLGFVAPLGLVFLLQDFSVNGILFLVTILLFVLTLGLYVKNNQYDLKKIGE